MTGTGKARAGFSLMEILMAVGILGVGMTMVASVFPVAVDQSRRSRDLTMAALSARSVAAALRARRQEVVNALRDENPESAWGTFEDGDEAKIPKTARLDSDQTPTGSPEGLQPPLPRELRSYNPRGFLYDDSSDGGGITKSARQYSDKLEGIDGLWSAGSYVPVVFATPIRNDPNDNETNNAGHGPWRITIVIYKSRGRQPVYLSQDPSNWVWNERKAKGKNPGGPGSYIMDWRFKASVKQPNNRGEAYKVQRYVRQSKTQQDVVIPSVAFKKAPGSRPGRPRFTAFVAGRDQNEQDKGIDCHSLTDSIPSEWISLPGAIAAYHTILGD